MHDSAFRIGELVMGIYCDLPNAKVLEVGSRNVNGCLRDVATPSMTYVGLDFEEGPSVDFVMAPGANFPVEDDTFDLVMATSIFEHDPRFWDTFVRMCRADRVGGHIYVNAPSNGTVHRYPMDCWRFYPDAGLALAHYAQSEGLEIDLVESFVANRQSDVWNDFVAIFRKGPSTEPLNTTFVYHRYPSANARTWQSRAVYKESDATEDMSIIAALRLERESLLNDAQIERFNAERAELADRISELENDLQDRRGKLQEQEQEIARARADESALVSELTTLKANAGEYQAEIKKIDSDKSALATQLAALEEDLRTNRAEFEQAQVEKAQLAGQVATLESNLRQRQEEIEQAWKRADELTAERDLHRDEIAELNSARERLENQLVQSEGWVFDLTGERRSLERELDSVRAKLARAEASVRRLEPVVTQAQNDINEQRRAHREIAAGIEQLRRLSTAPEELGAEAGRLYQEWREKEHLLADAAGILSSVAQAAAAISEQKCALHKDIESLLTQFQERERLNGEERERLTADRERVSVEKTEHLKKAAQFQEQLERVMAEQRQQIRTLETLEKRVAQKDDELEWLRQFYQILESGDAGVKSLLPPKLKKRRLAKLLARNGMFDGNAYLRRYPDVAASGMDPIRHYLLHGMSEGRHF